jgi:23S rRNA (uracil1939-C5)-methyltransferase
MNAALARRVATLSAGAKKITELYAGAGNLTVMLAAVGRRADSTPALPSVGRRAGSTPALPSVVAVEADRAACEAARQNLAARRLEARVVEADAAEHAIAGSTDLVVVDPPRTGARAVAARLVSGGQGSLREDKRRGGVRRVLYVSCDTQTLARDLAILAPRYSVTVAEAFEMFPQTSHVECVVLLERRRG